MKSKHKKIFIFIIYIVLLLIMFYFHENWRDEVQSYLLCRDMNFLELLKNIHYEGHPFFYYLLLYPFVKMGFGLKIVNVLSLVFMIISAYLILFKSKIKDIYKISIIFSQIFLYEYSIIGRSYSLIVLLVILIALLWEYKKNNAIILGLLIGLLLNTHIFMGGFCFLLFIMFYGYELLINRKNNSKVENRKILIGFIIICLFGIILILQFLPILFHGVSMSINNDFSISNVIYRMFLIIACFRINQISLFLIIFFISLMLYLFMLYKENKKLFVFILLNSFLFSCITIYVYGALLINKALLTVLFIYFICLINYNNKSNFILMVMFLLFIPNIIIDYNNDITRSYSSAEYAYKYIEKNISKDSIITTMYDPQVSTIGGYTKDYKFYDFKSNRYFTYIIWDKKRENKDLDYSYIDNKLNDNTDIYYISIKKDTDEYDKIISSHYNLVELYKEKEKSIISEDYVIYKINSIKEN